jgi:hypothetical protein
VSPITTAVMESAPPRDRTAAEQPGHVWADITAASREWVTDDDQQLTMGV